jgi:hypothetical protein
VLHGRPDGGVEAIGVAGLKQRSELGREQVGHRLVAVEQAVNRDHRCDPRFEGGSPGREVPAEGQAEQRQPPGVDSLDGFAEIDHGRDDGLPVVPEAEFLLAKDGWLAGPFERQDVEAALKCGEAAHMQ